MKTLSQPQTNQAPPGRTQKMTVTNRHFVTGNPIQPPFPKTLDTVIFGLGCFWGAERRFWQVGGVYTTAVGYSGGYTANASYEEVCTGLTGHNEVILIVFDSKIVGFQELLELFWQSHNPTQGMQQGNDKGTQYRSGIYTFDQQQQKLADSSKQHYQKQLTYSGYGNITTEILTASEFYYAEDYHQQYLAKNPSGYCGLGGTNVRY